MTDPLTETATVTAKSVAGFMGATLGELVKDEVHYLRWKNAHRILDKAETYLRRRSAKGKRCLPQSLAIRFLDSASLEDDPVMQDLWARLLANAADPSGGYDIEKTHISILTEMNGLDAEVLQYFRRKGWLQFKMVAEMTGKEPLDCETIAADLNRPASDVGLTIGNLWRLGCLLQEPTWESGIGPSIAKNSTFRPSPLGTSLLHAVSAPSTET